MNPVPLYWIAIGTEMLLVLSVWIGILTSTLPVYSDTGNAPNWPKVALSGVMIGIYLLPSEFEAFNESIVATNNNMVMMYFFMILCF